MIRVHLPIDAIEIRFVPEAIVGASEIGAIEARTYDGDWYAVFGLYLTDRGEIAFRRVADFNDDPGLVRAFRTEPVEHGTEHVRFISQFVEVDRDG